MELKAEIVDDLRNWAETFECDDERDEESGAEKKGTVITINEMADRLENGRQTAEDCDEIKFHLWQMFYTDEEIEEHSKDEKDDYIDELKEALD